MFWACLYNYKFYTGCTGESITQEFDYGCGIACFALALDVTYKQAANRPGDLQYNSTRFWIKDFTKYMKAPTMRRIYKEGTIISMRKLKPYPTGNYLIRHKNHWRDPSINLPSNKYIKHIKSGFRKQLSGKPMFALPAQFLS